MSVTLGWRRVDPSDVEDFAVDWTDILDGETISGTPTYTPNPTGPTVGTVTVNGATTQARLSGFTPNTDYEVTVRIATSGGRTIERTFGLQAREL